MGIYDKIHEIPPVPPEIIGAVDNDRLAVFIGAGVSRLVGCWSWDKLASELVTTCFETISEHGSPVLNFKQKEQLLTDRDHRRIITICRNLLRKNGLEETFFEVLENAINGEEERLQSYDMYEELYGLRGLFITTNVDRHFDSKFTDRTIVFDKENFSPDNIDRTNLYHIHGSILDRNSIVFSVSDYIRRYNDPPFQDFLTKVFYERTILFVGYGLSEFELLDYVISKNSAQLPKPTHFLLNGYYKGEEELLALYQHYYGELGITAIAYEMDRKGYDQLYDVVKEWNREINRVSTYTEDSFQEIDKMVNGNAE